MTEPTRWRDDASADPDLVSLLEHARPSPEMPQNVDAILRSQMTHLAKTPALHAGWARALGFGGGTGLVIVLGVVAWHAASSAPSSAVDTQLAASAPIASRIAPAAPGPSSLVVTPAPSTDVALPLTDPSARRATKPSTSAGDDGLDAEAQYLEHARKNLDARPSTALAELDAHATRFPKGQLVAEREYLAIVALHNLGRESEAARRANRFFARFPSSPYVPLLEKLIPRSP